jgi:transposase-like protein
MSERMVPFHCPYCGEEDLRPHEATHGTWECHSCLRAFSVKFLGQLRPPSVEPAPSVEPVETTT